MGIGINRASGDEINKSKQFRIVHLKTFWISFEVIRDEILGFEPTDLSG